MKIYSIFLYGLLMIVFVFNVFAEETCVHCGQKDVEGAPNVQLSGLGKIMEAVGKPAYSFESYQSVYCVKYTQIERNEVNQMLRDIRDIGYPLQNYFTKPGCTPQKVGGVRSPLLHLTAEGPCSRGEFPSLIYTYYKKHEPGSWLEIINAKNTAGETYLDYIETLRNQNEYNTSDIQQCVDKIIAFACDSGGVYSKVKNKTCSSGK